MDGVIKFVSYAYKYKWYILNLIHSYTFINYMLTLTDSEASKQAFKTISAVLTSYYETENELPCAYM